MTPGIALATYLVLSVALFGLLAGSSRGLDATTRGHMRRWIYRADADPEQRQARGQQWAEGFVRWFDHAFRVQTRRLPVLGEVPLPSLRRSILVSFLSLLVLALVWISNKPGMGRAMGSDQMTPPMWEMTGRLVLLYGGATLITNWIPDYLSLIESRLIMGKMARASSWAGRMAWLVVDACATLVISFFAIHIGMVVLLPLVTPAMDIEVGCLTPATYSLETTWELFTAGLRFDSPAGTLNYDATGIYIYSTFLTSLWVWIYLGGGFLLRLIYACRAHLVPDSARSSATDHRRPLRAMGILLVLTFSAIFWPSWAHRRAHTADVYIHHVAADADAARELAGELRAAGLRARTTADTDEALATELLTKAGAVIVLESMATIDGELQDAAAELHIMGECGERPWASSTRVTMHERYYGGTHYYRQDTDRYRSSFDWRPGQDADEVVQWAQGVGALLLPGQVRACQGPGHSRRQPAPAECDSRPR